MDEETFNDDLIEIKYSILDISDDLAYLEEQVKTLNSCESLMKSYVYIEQSQ